MLTRSEVRKVADSDGHPRVTFSCETIPYFLATTDALIILLFCLFGAFFYHWIFNSPLPDLAAYFALGLIASFIHIVRLGGHGYYDFERVAKPGVEITEVLVSWFSTGLMLAFFAFVFKIGVSFSRGTFLLLMVTAPFGLLGQRKFCKLLVERAVSRGAIGRRNRVLVGDEIEIASLGPRALLDLLGACEITGFVLSYHRHV